MRKRLQGFAESIPSVWLMMVLDKSGTAIEACDSWLLGRNFSEHEYFKRAQKNPDLERLYISAPFKNEVNTLTIAATTMLPDLEGRFNGAIVTILDPKTTVELLKSVLYAQDARASVAYGEGALFLLAPEYKEGLVVESGLLQPAYAQHLKASELLTLQQVRGVPQNEHRMLALHTVNPAELHMDAGCWLASVGMCRCSTVIITAMHI